MRRRDPHLYDEQYDGVLSALALSGGVAALPQLAVWLDSETAARALVHTVVDRRLGTRVVLTGERTEGLVLRRTTIRLLTGRASAGAVLEVARFTAVHRFAYHQRYGRPLHPTGLVSPTLFARATARHPSAADAMWRSLSRLASLFVDLDPDGARLVVVDRGYTSRQYRRLFDALAVVGGLLGQPVRLRVLAGSGDDVDRIESLVGEITGDAAMPWVEWDALDMGTAGFFAPRAIDDAWRAVADTASVDDAADAVADSTATTDDSPEASRPG